MIEEIWKVYKITNRGTYEVSNYGRLKLNGELIEPRMHVGYPSKAGFFIHRAVAELYIPNPDNKPDIDHIDTDRTNNNVYNLRWVTQAENNRNPLTVKLRAESNTGTRHKPHKHFKHKQPIKDTSKMGKGTLGKHKIWDDKDKNIYHFE